MWGLGSIQYIAFELKFELKLEWEKVGNTQGISMQMRNPGETLLFQWLHYQEFLTILKNRKPNEK